MLFTCIHVTVVSQEELKPEDLVGPRLLKKKKPKEVSTIHSVEL